VALSSSSILLEEDSTRGGVVSDNVAGNVALFMEQRLVKVDNIKGGRFIPVKTAHT